ncbi:hypothetical protein Pla100_12190 [Neorhodopirellula pilleata]|uniref:Uncharacterized protein n=1 Tax=Neorhodopirellula pilleata TaxID=2714738 RepID=A0A5C6ATL9_9BACT|nr:hypothetical protein Pla100_12190 [Neorhodopirellula pilleata]
MAPGLLGAFLIVLGWGEMGDWKREMQTSNMPLLLTFAVLYFVAGFSCVLAASRWWRGRYSIAIALNAPFFLVLCVGIILG